MKFQPAYKLAFCIFALAASGCATVTRGTKDSLVIETTPPGAVVEVNGQKAQTPCSIKLSRKFEGPLYITRDGYEPVTVQVTSSPSGAGGAGMAGNVLVGGLIGAGVDVATGATNSLHPNPIKVELVPLNAPAVATVTPSPTLVPAAQEPPPTAVESNVAESSTTSAADVPAAPAATSVN
jgi:hypothetical protein